MTQVAYSYLLMGLLLLPMLQWTWTILDTIPLAGEYERVEKPNLTLQNLWSGHFQHQYEAWHRENFGLRSVLVRIHNQIDFALFGMVHADKVIVGNANFLFEEPYLLAWTGEDTLNQEEIDGLTSKLLAIQHGLGERGKTFIVVLAPGKPSFFPEHVPPKYALARQPRNNGEKMGPAFTAAGINLIDFNQEYIANKSTSDYPLFGRTGIHWSNYGAMCSLQRIIAEIERLRGTNLPEVFLSNIILSTNLRNPDDDLGQLINLYYPIQEYPMAQFDHRWEAPTDHEIPRLTAFADSFFQQFVNHGISPGCFRDVDYYFYNSLVWSSTRSPATAIVWEPATQEAAMKSVEHSDVVLILATESNYSGLGFGYLDSLHETFGTPLIRD